MSSVGLQGEAAVAAYAAMWSRYDAFCKETRRVVVESFKAEHIECHTVEARAKEIDSFSLKAHKKNNDESLKYSDPITQITDLAAIRIITYTLSDVELVGSFIHKHFEVIEKTNVGDKRFEEGKFGYQSIHYLVRFPASRVNLPENAQFRDMVCEMQVRTVLQHAWAEIEHDIQYKNSTGLPVVIQRKFLALAGLLEIADREFQSIQDLSREIKKSVSDSLQEDLTRSAIAEGAGEPLVAAPHEPSVRQLARQGRYSEAVRLYDQQISHSPTMHTLFIGRAKAKFLSGDRAGAILDLDRAAQLNEEDGDGAVASLRLQIDQGFAPSLSAMRRDDLDEASRFNQLGIASLESGDGAAAFEYFSKAQEEGASRPFSLLNKAFSCVIAHDFEGAKIQMSGLELRKGTPFAVNLLAARSIVSAALGDERYSSDREMLEEALADCPHFLLAISPLNSLVGGLAVSPLKITDDRQREIDQLIARLRESPTAP